MRNAEARIIHVHVHLAADHVHLLAQFVGGQGGVHHDVAEDVDGNLRAGVWHVDVIDRAVEGGVGVHVAARILHLLVDDARGAVGSALEQHVLQRVRKSGAEPLAFVDGAGAAPSLRRDDGRGAILANDERQPVFQRDEPHIRRHGGNRRGIR